jgi:hypothetical protein
MTAVGWIGVWLLAGGLAAIALELVLITPRVLRIRRRVLALDAVLAAVDPRRSAELRRLRLLRGELDDLLRPYRRVRRWMLHPLTLALLESYRRRRSRS